MEDIHDPTMPDNIDHLGDAMSDSEEEDEFEDLDSAPEHPTPEGAAPASDREAMLRDENRLLRENLDLRRELEEAQATPPGPDARVMRTEQRADGGVEVARGVANIGRLNPLTLLTPKEPGWQYRWVHKIDRAPALASTGWSYVHAKSKLLAGIEGLPLDGIAQVHDLVCMRIPQHIYDERQKAIKARGIRKKMHEAERLRERIASRGGERVFGAGARRGLHGKG